MKRMPYLLIACLLMAGCATVPTSEPLAVEPYQCPAASAAITVDGRLDEADWQRAEALPIRLVFLPRNATVPPPEGTVRLLWDKDALYAGFSVSDADIWSLSNEADALLWNGDVVELFVKPSREAKAYCEFVIAPNGTLYDALYPSRGAGSFRRFKGWSSGARIATVLDGTADNWKDDDRGYTVEMAIPWSAFPAKSHPPADVTWTFGAFRYDYSKAYEDPFLLMAVPASTHGFHTYEAYRDIIFE